MAPPLPRRVPFRLKIAYTVFVCILVPTYWMAYGPRNFLWGSDIALFLICAALWLEHPLPNSMMAIGVMPFELLWCLDLLSGAQLLGSTAYMFEPERSLFMRALSLFHIMLPLVMLFLLRRLGYDRRALPAQTLLTWIVLIATYLLTDPAANINFAFGPGRHPQTLLPPLVYLGLAMLLIPACVCAPLHLLLRRLFPRPDIDLGQGAGTTAVVEKGQRQCDGVPLMASEMENQDVEAREVEIGAHRLGGILHRPPRAQAIILFAHGSGSSRFSPRNTYVAEALRAAGFATLLFDLLTDEEESNRANVFDIPLLAERLESATGWVRENPETKGLRIGFFGASTGAAAALVAAAQLGDAVGAVVSRGGRPDLAKAALPDVAAPTLLIVGGYDTAVIEMNEFAHARLRCEKELRIVPGATHLFEEPGTLDKVIVLARQWFVDHLSN